MFLQEKTLDHNLSSLSSMILISKQLIWDCFFKKKPHTQALGRTVINSFYKQNLNWKATVDGRGERLLLCKIQWTSTIVVYTLRHSRALYLYLPSISYLLLINLPITNTVLTSNPILNLSARKSKSPNFYLDITVLIFKNSCLEQNTRKWERGAKQKNKQQYLLKVIHCMEGVFQDCI